MHAELYWVLPILYVVQSNEIILSNLATAYSCESVTLLILLTMAGYTTV